MYIDGRYIAGIAYDDNVLLTEIGPIGYEDFIDDPTRAVVCDEPAAYELRDEIQSEVDDMHGDATGELAPADNFPYSVSYGFFDDMTSAQEFIDELLPDEY